MAKAEGLVFLILGTMFIIYLALPSPSFPTPSWDFIVSTQPADQETPLRRGYYTNQTREQVTSQYHKEFGWGLRLNYPPEESQTLIRDQTHSSYLEEVVHPFRESLFISGYIPTSDTEILIADDGLQYSQKVIVKFNQSPLPVRLVLGVLSVVSAWVLFREWRKTIKWIFQ